MLTLVEAGGVLGVKPERVREAISRGDLAVARLTARCLRIRSDALDEFVVSRLTGGPVVLTSPHALSQPRGRPRRNGAIRHE